MELEDLKRRWEEQDAKLEASVRLNTRLLRESVLAQAHTALRGLSRLLWLELLVNVGAVLCTGSFLAAHVSETRFLVPGVMLHLSVIALLVAGVRQLVALRTLDYGAPIVALQKRLETLRIERIRATTATLLASPLLWTLLLIVTLQGLFGVDAYATLGAPYLIANLLFGVLVIALAVWVSRRHADRMERSPRVQRLMRHLAGRSLTAAAAFLGSISQYEQDETSR